MDSGDSDGYVVLVCSSLTWCQHHLLCLFAIDLFWWALCTSLLAILYMGCFCALTWVCCMIWDMFLANIFSGLWLALFLLSLHCFYKVEVFHCNIMQLLNSFFCDTTCWQEWGAAGTQIYCWQNANGTAILEDSFALPYNTEDIRATCFSPFCAALPNIWDWFVDKERKFTSPSSGGWEIKVKVWAGLTGKGCCSNKETCCFNLWRIGTLCLDVGEGRWAKGPCILIKGSFKRILNPLTKEELSAQARQGL